MSPGACALGVALFSHLSTPALTGLLVLGCTVLHAHMLNYPLSVRLVHSLFDKYSCIGLGSRDPHIGIPLLSSSSFLVRFRWDEAVFNHLTLVI